MTPESDLNNQRKNPKKENIFPKGEILTTFEHQENENVYNPSRTFRINGEKFILARVEDVNNNISRVYPFVFKNGRWQRKDWQLSNLELEDPQIIRINNNFLIVVVRVLDRSDPNNLLIRSEFYYGSDFNNLTKIGEGPLGMKDIRFVRIEDENRFGIFLRPYIGENKIRRISYLEIENLDALENIDWQSAYLLQLPISPDEWVGTNDVYYLGKRKIGVLAHIGFKDSDGNLHYQAITFKLNSLNLEVSDFKVIATRGNFPSGKSKSPKHSDIVFPGGLEFSGENPQTSKKAILYCGLNDAQIGRLPTENPFGK